MTKTFLLDYANVNDIKIKLELKLDFLKFKATYIVSHTLFGISEFTEFKPALIFFENLFKQHANKKFEYYVESVKI